MPKIKKPNTYECPECGKTFRIKYMLRTHLAEWHKIYLKEFNDTYVKKEENGKVWYEKRRI